MKKISIIIFTGLLTSLLLCIFKNIGGIDPLGYKAIIYVSIFIMVITSLIVELTTPGIIGLVSICFIATTGLMGTPKESIQWALSSYSKGVVWLIFAAYMFAIGYEKSGLGKRIALLLIKYLGKRTITMGYSIVFMEFILGPFIPSNTARSGGTIFPIIKNIPPLYDSHPDKDSRKIGSYLMWIGICATCLSSTLYMTALAPNFLAVSLIEKTTNFNITWLGWFKYTIIPFGTLLLLVPIITYIIYPPTLKKSKEITVWAKDELQKMGNIKSIEIRMLLLSFGALLAWLFASNYINSTTVAIDVLILMVIFRVIEWKDIIKNSSAWNIFVWFSTLIALASGLKDIGFLTWIGDLSNYYLKDLNPYLVLFFIITIYYFIHYIFASITAHATALIPVMIAIGTAILPIEMHKMLILSLLFSLGIIGILTPYATGPAPLWYGTGYIKSKDYWKLGAIFGILFFIVLITTLYIVK